MLWRVEVHGKRLSFFSDTATRWRNEIEMEIRDYRKVNIFFWFMISFVLIFFWLQDYSSRWDMIYRPMKMKTSFLIILLVRKAVTGWRFRSKMSKLKAACSFKSHHLTWSRLVSFPVFDWWRRSLSWSEYCEWIHWATFQNHQRMSGFMLAFVPPAHVYQLRRKSEQTWHAAHSVKPLTFSFLYSPATQST